MGQIARTRYGCVRDFRFTNAEILQFPVVSPITLMVPPSGLVYRLRQAEAFVSPWTVALTNIDDATDHVTVAGGGGGVCLATICFNDIFAATAPSCGACPATGFDIGAGAVLVSDIAGAVVLTVTNGAAGAFTGGAIGNRFTVRVFFDTFEI